MTSMELNAAVAIGLDYLRNHAAGMAAAGAGRDKATSATETLVTICMAGKQTAEQTFAAMEKAQIENRDGLAVAMGLELNKKAKQTKKRPVYAIYRPFSNAKAVLLAAFEFGVSFTLPNGEPRPYSQIREECKTIRGKAAEAKAEKDEAARLASLSAEEKCRIECGKLIEEAATLLATVEADATTTLYAALTDVVIAMREAQPKPAEKPAKTKAKAAKPAAKAAAKAA